MSYAPNNNEFCTRVPFDAVSSEEFPTMNKALTGKANPRTLIKPTIAPPSHDITCWRQNPNVEHSQINTKTPMNPSLAGFGWGETELYCPVGPSDDGLEISSPYYNPLQPHIYTSTDDFQPINNNLGISYAPQFPNTTLQENVAGNELFFDTNVYTVKEEPFRLLAASEYREPEISIQKRSNAPARAPPCSLSRAQEGVYDPRFTGYGSSDRSYYDDLSGSIKYYYDDINAVRMPSYITRSKIDSCVTPLGDSYGALSAGHLTLTEAKKCAESSWLDNSLNFRVDLSKSLMRKKNEEMVQRRLAPKYTFGSA